MRYFVFDVESIGLHGEGFAVGWVVVDSKTGKTLVEGQANCDPRKAKGNMDGHGWVEENYPAPLEYTHQSIKSVRAAFAMAWIQASHEHKAWMAADCPFPVETRFLAQCVDNGIMNESDCPYPMIDIASVGLAVGANPLGASERVRNELPPHDPLNDARQSARLLLEYLRLGAHA